MFKIKELSSLNTYEHKDTFLSDSINEINEKYISLNHPSVFNIISKEHSHDRRDMYNQLFRTFKTYTSETVNNDEQETIIKEMFEKKLLFLLHSEDIEIGELSSADYYIENNIKKFSNTKYWLSDVASKCTKEPNILSKLLLLISRLTPSQMGEVGYLIAMAALNHSNLEIRENAIRIYETYSDQRSLEMLEASRPDNIKWLENYKNLVINDIKSTLQA